jgi:hypothetical protein
MISDRLACLSAAHSILTPPFIRGIGTSFRAMDTRVKSLEIAASIETIDGFLEVQGLENVQFSVGSQLRSIFGFSGCENLTKIEFPSTVEIVKGFSLCFSLSEVVFPRDSRLQRIDGFRKCNSLVRIEFPESTEFIVGFNECAKLANVEFSENSSVRKICGFSECPALCEIHFPRFVEIVEGFSDCFGLHAVTFPEDSHAREIDGFDGCSALFRIDIPASVVEISGFRFSGLRQLTLAPGTMLRSVRVDSCARFFDSMSLQGRFFICYDELDLKRRHRQLNLMSLGAFWRSVHLSADHPGMTDWRSLENRQRYAIWQF